MTRGYVPPWLKQAEANRKAREVAFWASPMAFWDKVFSGGAMARELAEPYVPKEVARTMKLDELKAAMRQHAGSAEALAATVRRWTPAPRKEGERFEHGARALKALDGSDLVQYPPEHVERMQKDARRALHGAEGVANVELGKLVAAAAKDPGIRFQQGTPLDSEHRGEVPLYLEEFRGRTRQEQTDLIARGRTALEAGDLQTALAVKRAKDILRVDDGEFDDALAQADPVRQEAKAELDSIQRLVDTWQGDVARRHVVSGMPGDGDTVAMVDAAARLGVSQDGSGGSFVQAAVGQ
jgi:hypothetical protein